MPVFEIEMRDYRQDGSERKWFDEIEADGFVEAAEKAKNKWAPCEILSAMIIRC